MAYRASRGPSIFLEKSGSLNFKHFSALGGESVMRSSLKSGAFNQLKWSFPNPLIWSVTQPNTSPCSLRSSPSPISLSQTDVFCGQKSVWQFLACERPCEQALSGAWGRERVLCIIFRASLLEVVAINFDVKMVDEATKRTVASIPTLKTKAGPRDSDAWVQRLKEEYTSLIKVKVIKAKK